MPTLGTTEILIIALVIVLLFGAKKLPDAARGIGRSLRIFKAETKGLRDDDAAEEAPRQPLPPAQSQQAQPQPYQPPQHARPQVTPPLEHDAKRDRT
jgi:sec-independent protein translocase protein TatA